MLASYLQDGYSFACKETCKIEMKKEVSAVGIWKAIVTPEAGQVDDLAAVVNVPADSVEEVKNDQDIMIKIKEKGPMIHMIWKTAERNLEFTFQFDKEFEDYDPYMKETTKNVVTKAGKTWNWVTYLKNGKTIQTQMVIGTQLLVAVNSNITFNNYRTLAKISIGSKISMSRK